MKAVVYHRFGQPDVLEVQDIAKPVVEDDGVLVRVAAASVNPADWHPMTGTPYLARPAFGFFRPKDGRLGIDFAGTVEAVGQGVIRFRPGDAVCGGKSGPLAAYDWYAGSNAIASQP